ncbi:MAG: RusA family crossover junction endodeoxyribonuclease [Alphaproteobacteria bacterium]
MPVPDPRVTAFVREGRPATANKTKGKAKQKMKDDMPALYRAAGGVLRSEPSYGVVYYFVSGYRPATDADADNLSKPVWDALTETAYQDDKLIRLRMSGVIEVGADPSGAPSYADINLSAMPEPAASRLTELLLGDARDILYVEIGPLNPRMFVFNLAKGEAP